MPSLLKLTDLFPGVDLLHDFAHAQNQRRQDTGDDAEGYPAVLPFIVYVHQPYILTRLLQQVQEVCKQDALGLLHERLCHLLFEGNPVWVGKQGEIAMESIKSLREGGQVPSLLYTLAHTFTLFPLTEACK
jgi:hypothetical protein